MQHAVPDPVDPATLPPYDPHATCAKCLDDRVGTAYRAPVPTLIAGTDGPYELVRAASTGEGLLRTCLGCGWAWLEACADAADPSTRPVGLDPSTLVSDPR